VGSFGNPQNAGEPAANRRTHIRCSIAPRFMDDSPVNAEASEKQEVAQQRAL
jgi:hypothetical protein